MRNAKFALVGAVCLLAGWLAGAALADPATARSRTRQLIVQFEGSEVQGVQAAGAHRVLPQVVLPDGRELRFLRRFEGNSAVVQLPESVSLDEARRLAETLATQPGIAAAVPDKRFVPAFVPNDPAYAPGVNAVVDPGQWHLFEDTAGIRMPAAWDRSTGSSANVVAVLDTGIIEHQDLDPARILPGYDFFSGSADTYDRDSEPGRDADPTDPGDWAESGDDCYAADPDEDASSWHGLSIAGVIAAGTDNSTDIAGMDLAARLLPVRVLGTCGGNLSDVADAIRWAAGITVSGVPDNPYPANVINLSLSGDGDCTSQEQSAINAAVSRGVVVVVASGNQGGNVAGVSPANCNNVIVVGAIARDGKIASYMNTGANVDVSAPGGDDPDPADPLNPPNGVLTLSNFGTTVAGSDALAVIQGTSFTAAQVSAVASLMLAVDGSLQPSVVESVIKATTRAFPDSSCNTDLCGTGVLDADAALAASADPQSVVVASGGGGGGGCALRTASPARVDPLWLLLLLGASCLRRRSRPGDKP